MAQQNINVGTSANDGTGDTLRDSQIKANSNFTELYTNKVDKIAGKGLSENDFTDAEQTKLDGIESGAQVNVQADFLQDDDTADDYIKNKPDSLYASVGYFHYADAATQTTPILLTASVEQKLTNDTLGEYTNISQAPYTVGSVWDASVNSFDFSQMSVGDTIDLRVDLTLETFTNNTDYSVVLKIGEDSDFEYTLLVAEGSFKTASKQNVIGSVSFSLDYIEHLQNPASIYITVDHGSEVAVNGWYPRIILKNVNIISFDDSLLKRKSESLKVNDLLLTGSDISIDLLIDGTSYYDFQNSGLVSLVGFETTSLDLAPSPQYPYEGKDFIIRNSTGNSITLKDNYEFAQIPFKLKGAVDVVMPNDSAIWFKLVNGTAEAEEIMRSFGSGVGSSSWGGITGTLADQTDLQSALDAKLDKVETIDAERRFYGVDTDGSQIVVDESDIAGGGGSALRTQTVEFAINQNIAASTNWYTFRTFNSNINTATLTATLATLTPANDFADMGIQTPCRQVNFNCRIKNARFRAGTNSVSTNIRLCVFKSIGASTSVITNSDIIADKTFSIYDESVGSGVWGCRINFTGSDIDDSVVIDAGSEIRFAIFNDNVASNLYSGILTIEFEEII